MPVGPGNSDGCSNAAVACKAQKLAKRSRLETGEWRRRDRSPNGGTRCQRRFAIFGNSVKGESGPLHLVFQTGAAGRHGRGFAGRCSGPAATIINRVEDVWYQTARYSIRCGTVRTGTPREVCVRGIYDQDVFERLGGQFGGSRIRRQHGLPHQPIIDKMSRLVFRRTVVVAAGKHGKQSPGDCDCNAGKKRACQPPERPEMRERRTRWRISTPFGWSRCFQDGVGDMPEIELKIINIFVQLFILYLMRPYLIPRSWVKCTMRLICSPYCHTPFHVISSIFSILLINGDSTFSLWIVVVKAPSMAISLVVCLSTSIQGLVRKRDGLSIAALKSPQAHRYQDDGLTLALIDWLKSVSKVTPENSQKETLSPKAKDSKVKYGNFFALPTSTLTPKHNPRHLQSMTAADFCLGSRRGAVPLHISMHRLDNGGALRVCHPGRCGIASFEYSMKERQHVTNKPADMCGVEPWGADVALPCLSPDLGFRQYY
ncbi:hypothetical protein CCUS01_08466 [Colletotrichum cuscutae]|uniref:Uncharacterized protein n=1 Tax=Colletotrichum cuscutae TaxID=1209917 RepID=A0AAI9XT65_9PEZI|nr:hypothetical protein CCUS01_08466 [Colletotrichum cuscutae]